MRDIAEYAFIILLIIILDKTLEYFGVEDWLRGYLGGILFFVARKFIDEYNNVK